MASDETTKSKGAKDASKSGAKAPKAAGAKAAGSKAPGAKKPAAAKPVKREGPAELPALLVRYRSDIIPALMKEFGFANVNQVPKVQKVTINFGLGEATGDPNVIKTTLAELTDLAGQKAVATKAKKAIANFKLRAGQPIGVMVTLRRQRMWDFLLRLMSIAIPRIRDFKGVSNKAFDGRGNYSLGLKEQSSFLELSYERITKVRGLNITITTSANNDAEGKALLGHLGMPFRQETARSA